MALDPADPRGSLHPGRARVLSGFLARFARGLDTLSRSCYVAYWTGRDGTLSDKPEHPHTAFKASIGAAATQRAVTPYRMVTPIPHVVFASMDALRVVELEGRYMRSRYGNAVRSRRDDANALSWLNMGSETTGPNHSEAGIKFDACHGSLTL